MSGHFRWIFATTIVAKNGAFAVARELELPFVPTVGLLIHQG